MLTAAIRAGFIDLNPLSPVGVRAPRGRRSQVKHIEHSDLTRLLEHLDGSVLGRLVLLMFATGVRPGEALAARWRDIDLDGGTWHVSGTLRRAPASGDETSKLVISSTKTPGSDDVIPLAAAAVAVLTEHRRLQAAERACKSDWENHDLVFCTGRGRPLAASNVLRALKRQAERAGVPDVSLHRLRHSAATAMLEEGVSAAATSRMLRHAYRNAVRTGSRKNRHWVWLYLSTRATTWTRSPSDRELRSPAPVRWRSM